MKYSKDKKKKLQKGGKTPQQIMEEARRNQAIEQGIQAENNTFRAMNIRPVSTLASTVSPTIGQVNPNVATTPERQLTFGEAFAQARKAGLKEFTWNNKLFTTNLKNETVIKSPANTNVNTLSTVTNTSTTNERNIPPVTNVKAPSIRKGLSGVSDYTGWTGKKIPSTPTIYTPSIFRRDNISLSYQQGGVIQKPLHLRNIWERIFNITPKYTDINNEESIVSYMDGNKRKDVIRKEIPYGNKELFSTRIITNPLTDKADTTYVSPSGLTFDNKFIKKNPNYQSYLNKFGSYFKYQQGGKAEQINDQLYVDFAVRYLNARGISEEDMTDETGALKAEYIDDVTTILQEVNTPEFWEEYKKNPDKAISNYIGNNESPEQVEMAKKGMKLKSLKDKKARKCKCGCNLILKKGDGGTIVEVCACGCKNK